jgi:hypothetical protein
MRAAGSLSGLIYYAFLGDTHGKDRRRSLENGERQRSQVR